MKREQLARVWRRVVPATAALAYLLGVASFLPADGMPGAALKSLQLFVINVGPAEIPDAAGWFAAILAPLATAGAAIYAFGERSWGAWQLLRLRARPADDLFVGGGAAAAGVAVRRARMLATGGGGRGKLVGIDLREEAPLARAMEEFDLPGFVLAGDALAEGALRPLLPHRAGNVWVMTGDDHRNLEVARRVRSAIESAPRPVRQRAVRLLVDVRDRRLLRAADVLSAGLDATRLSIDFFSLPRLAARTLLREHPPRPGEAARAPHLLILGAGELAAALLVHAAQHCVHDEDPAHCVRIALAGRGAAALLERLRRAFPALSVDSADPMLAPLLPLARIEVIDCDEAELAHVDWLRLQRVQPFDAVYAACERDLGTLAAATRAVALRELTPGARAAAQPVIACLQQPADSARSLDPRASPAARFMQVVQPFDLHARCFRVDETYPGEGQDRRAMVVHAVHQLPQGEAFAASPERVREASALWAAARQEDFRWSDRLAADHVDVKLDLAARATGDPVLRDWRLLLAADPERVARSVAGALRADAGLRTALARLEHRRFIAERLLEGWLPLPAELRNRGASGLPASLQKSVLRLNHTLVPFDRLPEADPEIDQQARDLKVVDAIPEILRAEAMLRGA
ncbi:hypothetical protein [Quisquiliibacterium transsilvanicum]|uniref:RCK N-terminal domain-containing protein n=1 Tax=Quisquiliibacterium transsilvanicum TaxID=1549638 RepID=A0A7W8HKX0_9BURK|nr:hypothetical protein [Quisquiliibacterium transsilvanicum]MBB5273306.1 hypothetical protein [Quisquiliibacterium transsilvanicum]